jgi:hypothetical protein
MAAGLLLWSGCTTSSQDGAIDSTAADPATGSSLPSPASSASTTDLLTPTTIAVASTSSSTIAEVPVTTTRAQGLLVGLGLTDGVALSGADAAAALTVLDEYRAGLLQSSPGFTATSTKASWWDPAGGASPPLSFPDAADRFGGLDQPPEVAEVTVLASGDMWVDSANGDWYGFDAATGQGRGLFTNPVDDSRSALEWAHTPLLHDYWFALGHDPLANFDFPDDVFDRGPIDLELTMSATTLDGRQAIEVTRAGSTFGITVTVVDLATGLTVGRSNADRPEENGAWRGLSMLSDVRIVDALPVDTVPELPDEMSWTPAFPKDDPLTAKAVTVDEAAEAFGSGLLVTQAALAADIVLMEHTGTTRDSGDVGVEESDAIMRNVRVQSVQALGLTRQIVTVIAMGTVALADRVALVACPGDSPSPS